VFKNHKRRIIPERKAYLKAVWARFRSGDLYAFEEIYSEFIDSLFAYGIKLSNDRELVKDSIQDLFIDLYRYKINLRNPESLDFYLFKSLKRLIHRKQKRNRKIESFGEQENFSLNLCFDMEESFIQKESKKNRLQYLTRVLNGLTFKRRELLFHKFNNNLSYKEIGKLIGIKPESAKKQVCRIIKDLRENVKFDVTVN
jgi:RNA polymerase sigma factor (sigma-70 family)